MAFLFSIGPMGQRPGLSTYTLLTLVFPLTEGLSDVISILEKAANQIVEAYPYLSGQVVTEPSSEPGSTGKLSIVEYPPHAGDNKFVHVKDCKDLCPSFEELAKARAPTSMLDGSILSPAYGFSNFYPPDIVKPVVIMQVIVINGGILLTICTHHCVMDANGNEQFIQQFASLCRGETLLEENIRLGNADQDAIFPQIKPGETADPLELFRGPSKLDAPRVEWPPAPSTGLWRTYRFTRAKVASLKERASKLCDPSSSVPYISSNDAVSAFIWTRLASARTPAFPSGKTIQFVRAVNGRRKLNPPIPAGYMGHSVSCCYTSLPVESVINDDLSLTAIAMRRSLLEIDDHHMRSFVHQIRNEKDLTTIDYGNSMTEGDLMMTSFVAQKLYETSFGDILKMPEFIRRPQLPDSPGLSYLMPATREGHIDLITCVTEAVFKILQGDKEWNEYVEFLG